TTTVTNPTGGTASGTNFSATVTVTPTGATGDVSLTALSSSTPPAVLGSFGPFSVSATTGIATVQTNLLPPGTAFVSATYGGDSTHGMSTSTPLALAGTVQGAGFTGKVQLNFVTFDTNGNPVPTTQSKTVAYGSPYILNVLVSNGTSCGFPPGKTTTPAVPCPTGTITFTDNGSALNDFPSGPSNGASNKPKVSNQGLVEDDSVQLPAGSHSIVASYSGDGNYSAGTSNTLSVTITKAATTTVVASSLGVLPAGGGSVTLTVVVGSASNSSQGPTGTIQFQNGSTNIGSPVSCTPAGATSATVGASCTATLANATISALFPPPSGDPRPTIPLLPTLFALLSIVLFALGWRWMPEKRRRTYAYAGFLAFALLAVGIAGCGGGSSNGTHTVTIKASYVGDANYAASSGTTPITIQ
ncbi:MAG TPA: Ig-like domain-containing protein, partial [Candidatus Acidoferrales bacterium]|nr:Ig-like domain-containing protein [Candidatus Acidoferrales bacterium]